MNEAHEPRAPVVSPVLDVATLVNRATNCKLLARKRLGELTRQRKAVQQQLRQFEARGHWLQAGKRERDEEAAPAAATSSTAGSGGATQSGEAAQMDVDVDHQPAHKRARRIDNGKPIPLTVMSNDEAPASVEGIGSSEPDRGVRSRPAARMQTDDNTRQRNRKMFGLLRNTLRQAREQTNAIPSAQQQKLEKVEQKLKSDREKLLEEERNTVSVQLERAVTAREAIEKNREIIDEAMRRITRDSQRVALANFLKTKTAPTIYFKPRVHNDQTSKQLEEQQKRLLAALEAEDSPLLSENPLAGCQLFGTPGEGTTVQGGEATSSPHKDTGVMEKNDMVAMKEDDAMKASPNVVVGGSAKETFAQGQSTEDGIEGERRRTRANAVQGRRGAPGKPREEEELMPMEEPELTTEVGTLLRDE